MTCFFCDDLISAKKSAKFDKEIYTAFKTALLIEEHDAKSRNVIACRQYGTRKLKWCPECGRHLSFNDLKANDN